MCVFVFCYVLTKFVQPTLRYHFDVNRKNFTTFYFSIDEKNKQTIKFAVSTVEQLTVELSSEVVIGFIDARHVLLLEMREADWVQPDGDQRGCGPTI